ncbi:MAG TPA: cadherin repeat domain-containing protein [Candidatus Angelobacter sp.]|nr:cadherin repeat domain-containing protein [Candidatus Angelobacter sp.]
MKIKRVLSSAGIYGIKNLRALIIVAALAQMLFGQAIPLSMGATSSDFSISISPAEVVIPPGGTADYTITVTGPTSTTGLTFSISGLPADSRATISRESASVYSLTVITSRETRQGEYTFTVTAESGGMSASASAELIVLLSPS